MQYAAAVYMFNATFHNDWISLLSKHENELNEMKINEIMKLNSGEKYLIIFYLNMVW